MASAPPPIRVSLPGLSTSPGSTAYNETKVDADVVPTVPGGKSRKASYSIKSRSYRVEASHRAIIAIPLPWRRE